MPRQAEAFEQPPEIVVVNGEVVVFGPEGHSAAFTPDAAQAYGRKLIEAAETARNDAPPKPRA